MPRTEDLSNQQTYQYITKMDVPLVSTIHLTLPFTLMIAIMTTNNHQPQPQSRRKMQYFFCHKAFLRWAFISMILAGTIATGTDESESESVCQSTAATTDGTNNNNKSKDGRHTFAARRLDHGVLEWIANQPGAYYNPKQFMDEPNGLVGIFATAPIAKGELLCRIPWEWTIQGDTVEASQLSCSLVANLKRQLELGKESKYAPYILYLKNQSDHQLVSTWSKAGQDLMLRVLGQTREENNHPELYIGHPHSLAGRFPPELVTNWLAGDYHDDCQGDHTGYKAALSVITRSDDSILIPGYDFVRILI
jgi:hypothetical protein